MSLDTITKNIAPSPSWLDLEIMKGFPCAPEKQVKNTNWVWYPFNRWGFQNVSKFLPTTPVVTGSSIPWEIASSKDVMLLASPKADGEPSTVENILNSQNTDAFVVVHKGIIVQEKYFNEMTPNTQHWLASMTKSFTGLVSEILISKGLLEREALVETYVSELKGTAIGSSTIQQLLDMTAGTAWDESMDALMNEESFARQYGNAVGTWPIDNSAQGVFGILPQIGPEREHGESFVYNSPLTDAMGWVISAVTGKRYEEVLSELFLKDLGTEDDVYMMADTKTHAWATGGLNMTARDAARFGQLLVNKGQFGGKQIFPESVIKSIENSDVCLGEAFKERIPGGAYSSFFWLTNDEDGSYMAKGMFSQYIYINPTKEVVIVRLASPEVSAKPEYDMEMLPLFKAVAEELSK
ncbi:beta-lactamase family protein [Vibrio kyushuensis]|uniref:serine hydrolase domain-containing protein n=1 Tax=Vibrio kyushuensis TaxID=2910249 RepID=UPI003D0D3572